MHLSEVRINLCGAHHGTSPSFRHGSDHVARHSHAARQPAGGRLKAFCSLTFDETFVIRDVKLIEGNDGLFLAMPSRKLCDHCPTCGDKNHLRARYCNGCGQRLDEDRHLRHRPANGGRPKLHADIAHPIHAACRREVETEVLAAYWREVERSREPGYIAPSLDAEDFDFYDDRSVRSADTSVSSVPVAETLPPPASDAPGGIVYH